jgi:hypothetical protein
MRFHLAIGLLVAALAACGGGGNGSTDAPGGGGGGGGGGGDGGGGGGQDAPATIDSLTPIDAPLGSDAVTVAVTLDGSAAAGVTVYFVGAGVSATVTTGADGTARANLPAGGTATVVEPQEADLESPDEMDTLDTFSDVQPGDVLHDDVGFADDTGSDDSITVNVTVPTDANANASVYYLYASCGEASDVTPPASNAAVRRAVHGKKIRPLVANAPVAVELDNCNGSADFLLVTYEDDLATLVDSIYAPGVAVADQGNVTIAGPFVPVGTFLATYADLGSAATDVFTEKDLYTARGDLGFYNYDDLDLTSAVIPGAGSDAVPYPITTGTSQVVSASIDFDPSVAFEYQTGYAWGSGTTAFAYDGSASLLPHMGADPAFDLATHAVTWPQGSAAVTADEATVTTEFDRIDGSGNDLTWYWNVIAPAPTGGSAAVAFPTLPTTSFDYNASGSDAVEVFEVETATFPGGYTAFRPHGFGITVADVAGATPTGTAQVSDASFEDQDIVASPAHRGHRHQPAHRVVQTRHGLHVIPSLLVPKRHQVHGHKRAHRAVYTRHK